MTGLGWFVLAILLSLESVPKSELGATTDVRQAAGCDFWLEAVLTLSASYGHTAQRKTAPKGRLTSYDCNCLRFLASCYTDQTQQAGAEEPDSCWNGNSRSKADVIVVDT